MKKFLLVFVFLGIVAFSFYQHDAMAISQDEVTTNYAVTQSSSHVVDATVILQMSDTTESRGLDAYSGKPVYAEYITDSSTLVGKSIDTIIVKLQKNHNPSGTVQVGVFNSERSVKQLFGTISASSIATNFAQYSFSLPTSQSYQIQSGDRIGVQFSEGNKQNNISIMTDQTNSFDGTNSYLTYYEHNWKSLTGSDLTMTLQLHVSGVGPTVSASPPGGTYSSPQSITLTASAPSTIFYTTDGSTPTTSSPNGPSPVSGIAISTNSTLKFFAKDSLGNTSPVVTQIYVIIQSGSPTITLRGSNPIKIPLNSVYVDPGAVASDTADGNLTGSIVTKSTVNTSRLGTYTVTYDVTDSQGSTAHVTRTVNVIDTSPVVHMGDTTATYGLSVYSGRQIQAEYVSSFSTLVNKKIDAISVQIKRIGEPSGTAQIGVFNSDLSVKQLFGTLNMIDLTGSYTSYMFSLPTFQTYQIQAGDRIGIKYTEGDASNYIAIMTDQTNSFDGTNSYLTYYTTTWQNLTGADLTMTLEQGIIPTDAPIVTPPNDILSVTTNSSRNIPNLGTPSIIDPNDLALTSTNNSTGTFTVGNTTVSWHATDSLGNIGVGFQKINVIKTNLPASQFNRVVMVNFDDDYSSIYTLGKPILDKYQIKITQYVVCGNIGLGGQLNWDMVHAMQSDGHDIQAHTMTHPHSNSLTQKQLDYEYGQDISCFVNNGTDGVHMVAMPYDEGYNNSTVINTIAKYYDMARGGNDKTFFLHCNNPLSSQTDCKTYDSQGKLNQYNRYNIRGWAETEVEKTDNYNDALTFSQFIPEVNSATTNTSINSTQVPIVFFHRVVLDNARIPNPEQKGTTTTLLDAEMKYLVDNNFKIWTTKSLKYDPVKNWFYFKG